MWKKCENGDQLKKMAEYERQARIIGISNIDKPDIMVYTHDEAKQYQLTVLKEVA